MPKAQNQLTVMILFYKNLRYFFLTVLACGSLNGTEVPVGLSARFELAEESIPLSPNEWTLGPLSEGSGPPMLYIYPQTTQPVRLYLIDTAVKHVSTWFSNNPKLTFRGTERVPSGSSRAFKHGTKLLSIIAGPETGAALGTPIEVVNYDVYPGGESSSTDAGYVAAALAMARLDHLTSSNPMPAVILIASGSAAIAESYSLQTNINSAVASGITVVVSAGNIGVDVSPGYIPAVYGLQAGIICVGANGTNGLRLPSSNYGAPVDVFAPGENIRTLRYLLPKPGAYELMTGTSPAAALATAAALIQLSLNPQLTPAQVEQALTGATASPFIASLLGNQAGAGGLDSDDDGTGDLLETFFGSNPNDPASQARPLQIQATAAGHRELSFGVASTLFDAANPYSLSNGTNWRIQMSTDLKSWADAEGSLTAGPAVNGIVPMAFEVQGGALSGFLRIELLPRLTAE